MATIGGAAAFFKVANGSIILITKVYEIAKMLKGQGEKIQVLEEGLQLIQRNDREDVYDGFRWWLEDGIQDALDLINEMRNKNRFQKVLMIEEQQKIAANLIAHLQELRHFAQPSAPRNPDKGTEPQILTEKPLGYEEEYEKLVSSLLGRGQTMDGKQVVAIIGRGGIGKTELARRAYNDPTFCSQFNYHLWASVNGAVPNDYVEEDLLRQILESADQICDANCSRSRLKTMFSDMVRKEKSYLLVLDDVAPENIGVCERLLHWLKKYGDERCRILITTRAKCCSESLNASTTITLNGISHKDVKRLLKKVAFGDEEKEIDQPLRKMLDNNVGKLHGSPLAAEIVGGDLKGKYDINTWKQRLDEGCHISSYYDLRLPQHLKRCFTFCSIFPREWKFEPEKLVRMWVAHSFVQDLTVPNRSTREEERARMYFYELVDRSLFEKVTNNVQDDVVPESYVIHEEIHSMLGQIAPNYFHRTGDKWCNPLATVRHLSVPTDRVSELNDYGRNREEWLKRQRTLLVYKQVKEDGAASSSTVQHSSTSSGDISQTLLKEFEGVRVLDFSRQGITVFPTGVISKLRKVAYLALPDTSLKICTDGMKELESLKSIHGTLSIKIDKTVNVTSASWAGCLQDKEHLDVLKLEWEYRFDNSEQISFDFEALKSLKPSANLKELHINYYEGTKLPPWLLKHKNLRSLHLTNCFNLLPESLDSVSRDVKVYKNGSLVTN